MLPSSASVSVNLANISVKWHEACAADSLLLLWYRSGNSRDRSQKGSTVLERWSHARHVTCTHGKMRKCEGMMYKLIFWLSGFSFLFILPLLNWGQVWVRADMAKGPSQIQACIQHKQVSQCVLSLYKYTLTSCLQSNFHTPYNLVYELLQRMLIFSVLCSECYHGHCLSGKTGVTVLSCFSFLRSLGGIMTLPQLTHIRTSKHSQWARFLWKGFFIQDKNLHVLFVD